MNKIGTGHMRHHSQMSHQRLHSRTSAHINRSNLGAAYQEELAKELTELE